MFSSRRRVALGAAAAATAGALAFIPLSATAAVPDESTSVTVLSFNDFHGRISADGDSAGAAVLAGAVNELSATNPNTVLVSAGDSIGASTFTSFIQDDNPTIDALVASGLSASAVGNHEFDKGFADLTDRVIPRYGNGDATTGADLALGANVYLESGEPALKEYAIREIDGKSIGFIGTVTTDMPTLVSPSGIDGLTFGDQAEAVNRVAAEIADETDAIVVLSHSGAAVSDDCDAITSADDEFGSLVRNASSDVDAIVSAHTHQYYTCEIDGRPVIQSDQYGTTLGQLTFDFAADGSLTDVTADQIDLVTQEIGDNGEETDVPQFEADPEVAAMVTQAEEEAEVLGSEVVGQISADILRGGDPSGSDRGVESTMGNLVADVYLWATTESSKYAGEPADLALMNPGGLRDDLLYGQDGVVTYEDVASVQPFANTLTTTELTGAQILSVLEEQWQPGAERPKLHLGVSDGFSYEFIDEAAEGEHVVSASLNGEPLDPEASYLVTTNSFVSSGGDGFTTFAEGSGTRDTGLIDLDVTVDYFAENDVVDPPALGRAVPYQESTPTPTPTTEPTSEPTAEPTTEPTTEPTAEPTTEPTTEPTAEPSQTPTQKPDDNDNLNPTGSDVTWLLAGGAAVLIAAGALTIAMRRRQV